MKRFVVTDLPVEMGDAAQVAFVMMFSNLEMNLEGKYEDNPYCTVCKSSHPKIKKDSNHIVFSVIFL